MLKNASIVRRLIGTRCFPLYMALAAELILPATGNAATIVVDATNNIVDGDTTSVTSLIVTPGTDGKISLHEAVIACNDTPGVDTVTFAPALANTIIFCSGVVPAITDPLTIDGEAQGITLDCDGASGAAVFILGSGSATSTIRSLAVINASAGGIRIESTGNTIQNMVLYGNAGDGIVIDNQGGSGNNAILGCKIGTDGVTDFGNTGNGILIRDSSNNAVGGFNPSDRNVISGNGGSGIVIISYPS